MARKRHSDEDILKLLREIELHPAGGVDVATACRSAGIGDATYDNRRRTSGGMGRSAAHGRSAAANRKHVAPTILPPKAIPPSNRTRFRGGRPISFPPISFPMSCRKLSTANTMTT